MANQFQLRNQHENGEDIKQLMRLNNKNSNINDFERQHFVMDRLIEANILYFTVNSTMREKE